MVRRRRVLQLSAVVVLAALVVVGAILLSSGGDDEETPAPRGSGAPSDAQQVQDLYEGIPQDGIHLGDPKAPATLVEIADLQCPFCAEYSTGALPSIVEDYVRPGRLRYELRFRSFIGRDSVRAAGAAAYAAQQDLMYEFADVFYRNQGPEESGYADREFIERVAGQVPGLDPQKTADAADDPLSQPLVREGEQFARDLGSTSTPDFYVRKGGRLQPLNPQGSEPEDYAAALDAILGAQ
ncbi:MAG TPA: thioredoxin domain-containing protein [Solirubrobacteraceae bacterium]|nr:thioredoxin domain-containing protein [Solirubrobacteraceae bacterium]